MSKHDLPSQSLHKGACKQCRLNWPASTVYPRGPKFTKERYLFCTHVPNTRFTLHGSKGVHSSMDADSVEILAFMYAKRTNKQQDHRHTCTKMDMHEQNNMRCLTSADKALKSTQASMHKYYTLCFCPCLDVQVYSVWQATADILTALK